MMMIMLLAVYDCTPADFRVATPVEGLTDPDDTLPGDVLPNDGLLDLLPTAEEEAVGPAPEPLQVYPPKPVAITSL